jgi:ABC-2 type transport system permease protein
MRRLLALVHREFWENKGAFRTTPLVIGGIYIVFLLMSIFTTAHFDNELYTFREAVRLLAEQPVEFRAAHAEEVMLGTSLFFTLVLAFVVFFYLLGALYDDRKDRSILFWKSLPISDLTTVLSKLATAAVLIPLVTLIGGFITAFVLMLVVSVDLLILGGSPWNLLWSNVPYFSNLILVLYAMVVGVLWYLPLMGYLMLVSAFAKRAVMMWAVLPPLVIALIETQFLGSDNFAEMLGERMNGFWLLAFHADALESMGEAMDRGHAGPGLEVINIAPFLQSPGLWLGLVAAGAFIAGAVYLRRYRDESL